MGRSLQDVFGRLRLLAAVQTLSGLSDRELLERFVYSRDESAFTVLIERHGPMVLGVCRRALANPDDAEDACQATFLVLARKVSSLRNKESLASWLHGVANRVVADLKREAARHKNREHDLLLTAPVDPAAEVAQREVQAVLDEELGRLPEWYRTPLILCYLERLTRDKAAARLGLSPGSLHGRLERGRDLLRQRLSKRGLTLSALLTGAALGECATLSPTMVVSSAKAAALVAAGQSLTELVGPKALTLTREVLKNMVLTKLKLGTAAVLCTVLLALVGGAFTSRGEAQDPRAKAAVDPTRKENDEDFIRRISNDLRGKEPTPAEVHFFVSAKDTAKRDKLIDLFIQERQVMKAVEAKEKNVRHFLEEKLVVKAKQEAEALRHQEEDIQYANKALLALRDQEKALQQQAKEKAQSESEQLRKELAEKESLLEKLRKEILHEKDRAQVTMFMLQKEQARAARELADREAIARAAAQEQAEAARVQQARVVEQARAAEEAVAKARALRREEAARNQAEARPNGPPLSPEDVVRARWIRCLEAIQKQYENELKAAKTQEDFAKILQAYVDRLIELKKTQPKSPARPGER
jgi:RNA polymerase sigma factor (sigma-70 family)